MQHPSGAHMQDEDEECLPLEGWSASSPVAEESSRQHFSNSGAAANPAVRASKLLSFPQPAKRFLVNEAMMVYAFQHPLHTGLPGKLYSRYDYVTPVADAIGQFVILRQTKMHGDFQKALEQEVRARRPAVQPPVKTIVKKPAKKASLSEHPNPQAYFEGKVDRMNRTPAEAQEAQSKEDRQCATCGELLTRLNVEMTLDKDGWVCKCGSVVEGRNAHSLHREKNCDESEDNTQRAEKVYEPKQSLYEKPTPSAEEARKMRVQEQSLRFVSTRAAKKSGVGFAPQTLNRQAAVEARRNGTKTENNPYGWSATELTRGDQLMRLMESLIEKHGPISTMIAFHLRSNTAVFWDRVVRHDRVCSQMSHVCKVKLSNRSLRTVAESVFDYHLDSLQHMETVSHEDVQTLKERVATKRGPPNAHMVSTRAMVSLMMEEDACVPCEPSESRSSSRAESPSIASPEQLKGAGFEKAPRMEEGRIPLLLAFRTAILRIHRLLQSHVSMSSSVREKAVELLSNSDFLSKLEQCEARPEQDKEARAAYVLLTAIEQSRGGAGSSNSSGQLGSIRSLLLVDERSEAKLVEEVRSILPENLWAPPPVAAEATGDGLFF